MRYEIEVAEKGTIVVKVNNEIVLETQSIDNVLERIKEHYNSNGHMLKFFWLK